MKKIAIFLLILIAIICTISYIYLNYKFDLNNAAKENSKFEMYIDKEIKGSELATIINKMVDSNEKNGIQKDEEGKYINNDENSINIDIKFIDVDIIINAKKIYDNEINKFLTNYRKITFKCNEVQYHTKTGKIKYMQFEQITT